MLQRVWPDMFSCKYTDFGYHLITIWQNNTRRWFLNQSLAMICYTKLYAIKNTKCMLHKTCCVVKGTK